MLRGWTARVLACAGVATALLAGCTAAHQASTSLPPTSAAATSPTLQPLGPRDLPMPAAARVPDATGAEAFIRYYFALLNRSLIDMDTKFFRQLAQDCENCDRIARETEQDARSGYTYRGGELTITGAISVAVTSPGRAESAFLVDQAAMTVLDASGNPVPGLIFQAKPRLSSGTLTIWDPTSASWKMSVLTLG